MTQGSPSGGIAGLAPPLANAGAPAATDREQLAQLAERARGGDRTAFTHIVIATTPKLYALAVRILDTPEEAEDALQDAYLKAWNQLGRLRERASVVSWLGRIVRNCAIDRDRRRKSDRVGHHKHEDGSFEVDTAAPDAATLAQNRQLGELAQVAVGRIPEKLRTVLLLRVADDLSNPEIAELLDCPVGTVESRLVRARRAAEKELRRLLKEGRR